MSKTVRARQISALVAAYVVALQALLLPLSVAAASPFETSLCAAAMSANGVPSPASHDTGCPCAAGYGMQCCAQTLAGPAQITITCDATSAIGLTPAPAIEPVIRLADRSPHIPRAPPVA
jgi:hypothetical protein